MNKPQYPIPNALRGHYLEKIAGFIWLDLETTGLDASGDVILEVAVQPAEPRDILRVLSDISGAAVHPEKAIEELKGAADKYVVKMHTDNGLWAECESSSLTIAQVDDILADSFTLTDPERSLGMRYALAGNSVGSFDLQWVRHHLPKFASRLSHRVFDVTTLIMFAEMLGWTYERQEPAHRAADDILVSQATTKSIIEFFTQ